MKLFRKILIILTLQIGVIASPPPGFKSLFNGKDLTGWWGLKTEDPSSFKSLSQEEFQRKWTHSLIDIRKTWLVENGELVNEGKGLYLSTEKNFADFELMLEYKTIAGADSGIYLRGVPQVQIWDTTESGGKWELGSQMGSGGLWNNGPPGTPGRDPLVHADKPFGEWNQFHITMRANLVTVRLNNHCLLYTSPSPRDA